MSDATRGTMYRNKHNGKLVQYIDLVWEPDQDVFYVLYRMEADWHIRPVKAFKQAYELVKE